MNGKMRALKRTRPANENTNTGGNQVNVPLLPSMSKRAIVVTPATRQVPIFFKSVVGFILQFGT